MLFLAWHTLRNRTSAFVGAFIALLCATALVTACGMLLDTGLRGRVAPERYAGAPLVVAADQQIHWTERRKDKVKTKSKPLTEHAWLPAATTGQLSRLPGVRKVVPELTFPVRTVRGGAEGHAWDSAALTPFTLAAGHAPYHDDEVVVDRNARLRPGDSLVAIATTAPRTYRVVGVTAQALAHGSTVFFAAPEARRLAGHAGQVFAIGVYPASAGPAVRDALHGTAATVYTGDGRGTLEFGTATVRTTLVSMAGALGGTSLLVAILVVVGTFTLVIEQRRRELALLRAVAATPRQVRSMIGREALLVGTLAGLFGAAAGLVVARWLRALFVSHAVMPTNLGLVVSPFPMAAGLLVALLSGWAAARLSVRSTARIRPAEAMLDASVERRGLPVVRALIGLGVLAGDVVLLGVLRTLDMEAAATPVTFLTVILGATAVALLGPLITRIAMALLTVPLRLSRVSGYLAAANNRTNARRLTPVLAPLTLAIGMTCTILFVPATVGQAAADQVHAGVRAEHVLTGRVPQPDALRGLPGVHAVTAMLPVTVWVGRSKYHAQGVGSGGLSRTIDPGVRAGSLDALDAGHALRPDGAGSGGELPVAVSTTAAQHLHARLGQAMPLALGDGSLVHVRVTAIYRRGLGFGDLLLPYAPVAAHVDDPLPSQVLVAGATAATLRRAVRAYPGVQVLSPEASRALQDARNAEVNLVIMGLIIAFTSIAVVNTLAMATAERAPEFALLRLIGTTRRQVLRMLRVETLTLALIAVVLGTAIAVATLSAYGAGMTGNARPALPPLSYLAIVAGAVALALISTSVPGRLALARNPAEAITARD